jgi:hypothetical protein
MGIDTCTAIPVPRPNTLLLENSWKTADSNNNMKVETNEVMNTTGVTVNRRRKKKRAADAGVKLFEGESSCIIIYLVIGNRKWPIALLLGQRNAE